MLLADDCGSPHSSRAHLDATMNAMEPEQSTQADTAMTEVAEGHCDLVPADASSASSASEEEGTLPGGDRFSSMLQTIGAPSLVELEKIIGELQQARTYLQAESERIERETVGYAELSQTAMESVRIIAETVGEWRKAGHPVRSTGG
jgi:hypothetical protein